MDEDKNPTRSIALHLRIRPRLDQRIRAEARAQNIKLSEYVRRVLDTHTPKTQ